MGIQPDRVKLRRKLLGMNMTELAYNAGFTEAYGWRIEGENPPNIGSAFVVALAKTLHTSTDYLLGLSDDPTPVNNGNGA